MRAARALCFSLSFFILPLAAQPVTEGESHIASAFTSGADHGVLAGNAKLGPALRGQLGGETESRKIYAALVARTSGRSLRVRQLPPAEAARHASLVGGLSDPLILLEAGELSLLMQYAPKDKHVTFVEQLSGPAPRSEAPKPVEKPQPQEAARLPPEAPQPAPVVAVPPPSVAPPAIRPVVVKPKPAPVPAVVQKPKPAPVAVPKPALRVAPRECVIKPVMTDEDLRACGAGAR